MAQYLAGSLIGFLLGSFLVWLYYYQKLKGKEDMLGLGALGIFYTALLFGGMSGIFLGSLIIIFYHYYYQ